MRYVSTRGRAPALDFDDVLLTGLARDGGLYVPETWPHFSAEEWRKLQGLGYQDLAVRIMLPFVEGSLTEAELTELVRGAYAGFDHAAVTPLKQLDSRLWLMELFHGPTLAFKDVALQLLGRLFDRVLTRRGERVTIVGATSGDTGSAAIEACRDREAIDIFMLHPEGRTSEIQRRQMTTVLSPNVYNLAIRGTFDDCQDLVKAMFNDTGFRDAHRLSAVNSINWARVMAQIVYYAHAALSLGAPDRKVAFCVPSGNFGNVFAGYAASRMGLPVERLIVGTNTNDILARFFASGAMEAMPVVPTISPSMDIQISSNFERLLFDLFDRDGARTEAVLTAFRRTGRFEVSAEELRRAIGLFRGHKVDEATTRRTIARMRRETGEVIDPHTAVGVAAARADDLDPSVPVVVLATAHPAKFPDAVEEAAAIRPGLPERLADLYDREERMTALPNDLNAVQQYIDEHARAVRAREGAK